MMAKIISRDNVPFQAAKISDLIEPFLLSRKTQNCSTNTIGYYKRKLPVVFRWFENHHIFTFDQITSESIRQMLSDASDSGHNKGGTHIFYRTLKTYLRWVWDEYDYTWRNPMEKVKCEAPRPVPIPGITIEEVDKLMDACKWNKFPERDRAMIAVLTDTGIRRNELMSLTMKDVDVDEGKITIRHAKGDKLQIVYCGRETRKLLRKYLSRLCDIQKNDPFWLTLDSDKLSADGALSMLRRTQKNAGLKKEYSFHAFRRCFALECIRNGDDIWLVSRKLNHTSVEVTKRYLAFTPDDDRASATRASPMDNRKRR